MLINSKTNKNVTFLQYILINLYDSGIKSIIDIVIITPEANPKAEMIIFLFFGINISTVPINVEILAKKVNKKGIISPI